MQSSNTKLWNKFVEEVFNDKFLDDNRYENHVVPWSMFDSIWKGKRYYYIEITRCLKTEKFLDIEVAKQFLYIHFKKTQKERKNETQEREDAMG